MATIKAFEEIEAWRRARGLAHKIFSITQRDSIRRDYSLRDQVNRSAGSIMDNIAEGFERGGNREFVQFLYIAKGSAGELRSQLFRMLDRENITAEEYSQLTNDVADIAKMIAGLIRYLQRSKLRGDKYHEPKIGYISHKVE